MTWDDDGQADPHHSYTVFFPMISLRMLAQSLKTDIHWVVELAPFDVGREGLTHSPSNLDMFILGGAEIEEQEALFAEDKKTILAARSILQ